MVIVFKYGTSYKTTQSSGIQIIVFRRLRPKLSVNTFFKIAPAGEGNRDLFS